MFFFQAHSHSLIELVNWIGHLLVIYWSCLTSEYWYLLYFGLQLRGPMPFTPSDANAVYIVTTQFESGFIKHTESGYTLNCGSGFVQPCSFIFSTLTFCYEIFGRKIIFFLAHHLSNWFGKKNFNFIKFLFILASRVCSNSYMFTFQFIWRLGALYQHDFSVKQILSDQNLWKRNPKVLWMKCLKNCIDVWMFSCYSLLRGMLKVWILEIFTFSFSNMPGNLKSILEIRNKNLY